ncbi:MAG TPA: ABC transporter ATP-binding protein [Bdellovibrionales bacterium]|nr:ABC transporter ATP-binding protein [Pseudobdellovibrionaceae bacterium]HAG91215.1 ABC transporter ATP-binding protein [Bdellovibrionales bacterium]
MLEFKSVHKSFGERTILKDLSFEAKKGEILFILGTSGTGKSVLLKLIVGLLNVTSGEIWIDGEKTSDYSETEMFAVRKKCGMVFQHPALFDSLNVFQNVSYGIRPHLSGLSESEIYDRVLEGLEVVGLGKDIFEENSSRLSYGVQKRVSLARTLALRPEILLFDEPTTGLDPVTTQSVNKLILDSSRKFHCTALVVSHDMDSALSVADRILVLNKGEIVELATPTEIKKSQVPLVKEFLEEVLDRGDQNHV